MSWENLLQGEDERIVTPWLGGRIVHTQTRVLRIRGKQPREHGWYEWKLFPRHVEMVAKVGPSIELLNERTVMTGYLVGDRFAPEQMPAFVPIEEIAAKLERVYLLDESLERFMRISVARVWSAGDLVFRQAEMPLGPEGDVLTAFYDRKPNLDGIKGITPALEIAYRMESFHREENERIRAEIEKREREEAEKRALEEKRAEIAQKLGDGAGRRELARVDFLTAARAALAVGGAELLDWRQGASRREFVVTYQVAHERLQCVVDETLHVVDAGVCLTDHRTGFKGDTLFTLESLPAVIREAIREDKLVKWRHG